MEKLPLKPSVDVLPTIMIIPWPFSSIFLVKCWWTNPTLAITCYHKSTMNPHSVEITMFHHLWWSKFPFFWGKQPPLIFGPTYAHLCPPSPSPGPQAISAALTACAVAIAWSSALQLFVTAGASAGHGSVRNALLGALAAAKRWEMAMELMPQVEKTPGHFSTHGALLAVSKGNIFQ